MTTKKYHPLRELVLTRLRTFYREPEAIFWTFGFPVLLTIALGIAFRNKPQEIIHVDVEGMAGTATVETVRSRLADVKKFKVETCAPDECADRLRLGKTAIVVTPGESLAYRYDPTRPESVPGVFFGDGAARARIPQRGAPRFRGKARAPCRQSAW